MSKIIEITTLKQLFELSSMGGRLAGYVAPNRDDKNEKRRYRNRTKVTQLHSTKLMNLIKNKRPNN